MISPTHYNAFTGIGLSKKEAIVQFIKENNPTHWLTDAAILKALEYAVKERSSFGGFILTIEKNHEILAVLIVNKTGMEEYMPQHIGVITAISSEHKNSGFLNLLMKEANQIAKGDIAIVTNSSSSKDMQLKKIVIVEEKEADIEAKYKVMPSVTSKQGPLRKAE